MVLQVELDLHKKKAEKDIRNCFLRAKVGCLFRGPKVQAASHELAALRVAFRQPRVCLPHILLGNLLRTPGLCLHSQVLGRCKFWRHLKLFNSAQWVKEAIGLSIGLGRPFPGRL